MPDSDLVFIECLSQNPMAKSQAESSARSLLQDASPDFCPRQDACLNPGEPTSDQEEQLSEVLSPAEADKRLLINLIEELPATVEKAVLNVQSTKAIGNLSRTYLC
jgi:hypothetical protein